LVPRLRRWGAAGPSLIPGPGALKVEPETVINNAWLSLEPGG